ncbi:MAG: hypothetical protein ACPGOX_06330, partial [Flavobacteriales bacterium]
MFRLFRLTSAMALAIAFLPSVVHAQFLGLQSEVHAETDLGTTYRIYAEFATASDECIAVYSVGTAECVANDENDNCIQMGPLILELGVTTAFYQHPAGSNMGSDINPVFFSFFPEMAYDSWLTIGSSSTADEAVANIGMTSDLAEFNAGSGFVMDGLVGGSWYVTPGANPAALAGDDGLVLLGQFTAVDESDGSAGHVSCLFNIQWRNASGVSSNEMAASLNTAGSTTVAGCMDATACNYNSNAVESDASCVYASGCDSCSGEADGSGTVVDGDSDDDGICDGDEVVGCQTPTACNYNASATDAGACLFATGCDECLGSATDGTGTVLDNDADNDGVCDADEITGCQNALACNYNAAATDAGTCTFPTGCETCTGETDGTGTTVANDDDGDGVCNADEVAGCQDSTACNYNAAATDAGEACVYPTGCESCSGATDGSGAVLANDDDGDGVCNADEIAGCQNTLACNYNSAATDAGTCVFATGCDECMGDPSDGTGTVSDLDADDDGVCDADEIIGCQNVLACNYNAAATDAGSCAFALGCNVCQGNTTDGTGTVLDLDADDDGVCDADEVSGCQNPLACNYNAEATDAGEACVLPVGCETCSGATDGTGTTVANDDDGDGVCNADEIVGCQDTSACDYDASATDAGSCTYATGCETCSGETDGTGTTVDNDADDDGVCDADEVADCQDNSACNYNAAATDDGQNCVYASGCDFCSGATDGSGTVVLGDTDGDGICDVDEIPGCQDPVACNYNASATDSDGSCTYEVLGYDCDGNCLFDDDQDGVCDQWETTGCQDATACNYDATATDAGYCVYADAGCDCNGDCLADADGDGVCDEFETAGCTDSAACNYAADATDDNGSCAYAATGYGCDGNCLFDDDQDGVCDQDEVTGCQDATACNYDATATDAGYCVYADAGYDCSGNCLADADGDGVCDAFESAGCADTCACNYDVDATDDDGSCAYPAAYYDCAGVCLNDGDGDGVCDENEIAGCTGPGALNFNPLATDEDGSCLYCEDADNDGACDNETPGCMDASACNYNAAATVSDGSCVYATGCDSCSGATNGTGIVIDGDNDNDGVCDEDEVTGCQVEIACNFNPLATDDDGLCTYSATGFDCDGNCLEDAD